MALHDAQELDNDLRGRADEHLALSTALGVDDVVQAVILHHCLASFSLKVWHKYSRGRIRGPFWFFGGLKRRSKHDARAQDECRAMESTSQAGLKKRGYLGGRGGTRNLARTAAADFGPFPIGKVWLRRAV